MWIPIIYHGRMKSSPEGYSKCRTGVPASKMNPRDESLDGTAETKKTAARYGS